MPNWRLLLQRPVIPDVSDFSQLRISQNGEGGGCWSLWVFPNHPEKKIWPKRFVQVFCVLWPYFRSWKRPVCCTRRWCTFNATSSEWMAYDASCTKISNFGKTPFFLIQSKTFLGWMQLRDSWWDDWLSARPFLILVLRFQSDPESLHWLWCSGFRRAAE